MISKMVLHFLNNCMNAMSGIMPRTLSCSPWALILFVSLFSALLILIVFKLTTNPEAIRRARNRVLARTIELHMYRDDPLVGLGALGRALVSNLAYLRGMVIPCLVSLLPMAIILVQLSCWFSQRAIRPGERFLLKAFFTRSVTAHGLRVDLGASPGLDVETPPFRIPGKEEIDWRLRAENEGPQWAELRIGHLSVRKRIVVASGLAKLSTRRLAANSWRSLLYPVEPPIPVPSPVTSIEVTYPRFSMSIANYEVHWLVPFFLITFLFVIVLKRPLKVEL